MEQAMADNGVWGANRLSLADLSATSGLRL